MTNHGRRVRHAGATLVAFVTLALVAAGARADDTPPADFHSRSSLALGHLDQARERLTKGALEHVLTRHGTAHVAEQAVLLRATRERLLDAIDAYARVDAAGDERATAKFVTQQETLLAEADRVAATTQLEDRYIDTKRDGRTAALPAPSTSSAVVAPLMVATPPAPLPSPSPSLAILPAASAPIPVNVLATKLGERNAAALTRYQAEASASRGESARTMAAIADATRARAETDAAVATAARTEGKRLVRRTLGWYGVGLGVATAAVGGALEGYALGDRASLANGGLATRTDLASTAQSTSSLSSASIPFLAIGSVLAATGAVLLYSARSRTTGLDGEVSARADGGLRVEGGALTW